MLPSHLPTRRVAHLLRALAAFAVALCAALGLTPAAALADGSPNIALTIDAQDTVLFGAESSVRLQTSNPAGSTGTGHNVSYRVVVPTNVTYVAGSAGAAGEPTAITGQPTASQTTLLWKNVADVGAGSTHTLDFRVQHSVLSYVVGSTFTVNASAYVGSSDLHPPRFTSAGQADATGPNPYTGFSANKTDSTTVKAVEISKSADNAPEGELLRGVHDQQSVHTVTIRNNALAQTTHLVVEDFLPAGLEFVGGCGVVGVDHTTNAPTNPGTNQEYPGAGAIPVAALSGCVVPNTVDTLNFDPAGPAPSGIYTRVRWTALGTIPAGGTITLKYRAAVPLRSNAMTWSGATPATTGAQAANLDNNSGPEVADGTVLTNYTRVQGDFNDTVFTFADGAISRTIKDLTVQKSARTPTVLQPGTENLWDLTLRTSEYRSAQNTVVTDTVPDGLCPLSLSANYAQTPHDLSDTADCFTGPDPSAPYATVQENASGTYTVVWNSSTVPALAELGPNDTQSLTFATRARSNYQENFGDAAPIVAFDTVRNTATVAAAARVICNGGVSCPPGPATGNEIANSGTLSAAVTDSSSDTIRAAGPVLDKRVAASSNDCATATYTDGAPAPAYRPGDRICWQLRLDYPTAGPTSGSTITDYLPGSLTFDTTFGTGGDLVTGNDTIGATTLDATSAMPGPGGALQWTIPSAHVPAGAVFEHRIGTTVGLPAGSGLGDVAKNLASSTLTTNAGTTTVRDDAPYRLSMPVLSTLKRVIALDGVAVGGVNGVATQVVRGGQDVTYRLRVANAGDQTAERVEAWDPLPAGVTCAHVAAASLPISDGGVCDNGAIKWGASPAIGPDVAPAATKDLTYTVRVPTTIQPTEALTSAGGVRAFQTPTNTGGAFVYVPASNVDPTQNPSANVTSPTSSATITGAIPTISTTRTTSIVESSGGVDWNSADNATIGETIKYTVSATVPAGVTVRDLEVTDAITTRQGYVSGSLTQTGGPAAASLAISGTTITMGLGSTWTAPTGADTTFTFAFDTTVTDIASNFRTSANLTNAATLFYTPPGTASGGTRTSTPSSPTTTEIVEPSLGLTKTVDVGTTPVVGNDVVEYTLELLNGTGATSPAHETALVDLVPADMTPLNASGNTIADGESTLDGGVWNAAARTLTFSPPATIHPGTTQRFVYRARVNDPATGGKNLTNSVTATTTSLAGGVTGERTATSARNVGYSITRTNTLNVLTASVATSVADTTLTIGQRTTYTLDVTIPANTIHYDATVKELLPDSIDFDGYLSASCTAGCTPGPTTPTIRPYDPVVNGATGTVQLAWDLGDLTTQAPVARTFRLTFGAHLRAQHRLGGSNVVRPQTSIDSVRVMANRTDKLGAFNAAAIPSAAFDDQSPAVTKTITAIEPGFTIDKRIAVGASTSYGNGPVMVHDGDGLKYRITVTNTGNAPAHNVEVTDIPNAELRGLTPATGTSTTWVTDGWSNPGDDIKWTIPGPILPGATATVDYTASLPVVTAIKDGDNFDNTAQVTRGWGVPKTQRDADLALPTTPTSTFAFRSYISATDVTRATFDSPTIVVDKTTGVGSGPIYPNRADAQVGAPFTWRVRVTNTSGTETATALTVRDTLPRNWTFVPGSASFSPGGSSAPSIVTNAAGDQLTWSTSISLAPGGTTVLSYQARPTLAAATTPGIGTSNLHVNTASATVRNGVGNAADESGAFAAAPETAEAVLVVPTFSVTATPDAGAAASGATVPFHFVVRNTSSVPATNVVVSGGLPSTGAGRLTYTPGTATASPTSGMSETSAGATAASWTIPSLAGGAQVDFTVPLKTNPSAPAGTTATTTASLLSDQTATAVTDQASVVLTPSADVAATKTAPASAAVGGTFSYTVGATNHGPSDAQGVVVTDDLPSTVTHVSSPGCTFAAPRVTCAFSGAVPAGASRTATITVKVNDGATGNADNTAKVTSTTPDPVAANNSATVAVPVGTRADLSLTKTAGAPTVLRGQNATFTLGYANAGPSTATGAQIVDTLPAGLTYVSSSPGCTPSGQSVTCTLGTLASGANGTRTIVARGTALGAQQNTATISSAVTDGATADNTATATVTVLPAADLGIAKTGPANVAAGADIPYVLTARNDGPDAATAVTIIDTLPAGTTLKSADAGCTAAGRTVTCVVGALASGQTVVRNVVAGTTAALGDQAVTNTASIDGAEGDPNPANDVASASTQIGPAADVSVTQTAPQTSPAGGQATFSIVARNGGPSTATGVKVSADLPAGVTVESVTSAQGSCIVVGRKITCDLGTLPNGASADVTVVVGVPTDAAGQSLTSTASVSSDQPDPDGSNAAAGTTVQVVAPPAPEPQPAPEQGGDPATPAETPAPPAEPASAPNVPKAGLSLTKTTSQVSRAGERLNYLITATNNGPDVATGVTVKDTLTGDVTFRSAKSSGVTCDFSRGVIDCPVGKLGVGDSVRINVAVTPNKAGVLVNNAVLSAATLDPDLSDNRAVATTTTSAAPTTLKVEAASSGKRLRGGQRVTYTVKVRNSGKAPAFNVDVCSTLPGQLAFSSTRGGTLKDARLCFNAKSLKPGERKVFKVRTRVLPRARRGSFSNKVTAAADNAGRVAFAVRSTVVTDGKVSSSQVRGFTG